MRALQIREGAAEACRNAATCLAFAQPAESVVNGAGVSARVVSPGVFPETAFEKFLAEKVTYELRNLSQGIPLVTQLSCVSSTTTSKDSVKHTVMESITFKYSNEWKYLGQKFQFLDPGFPYNTMTPTEAIEDSEQQQEQKDQTQGQAQRSDLIVPRWNYTFIYFGLHCAVVKVELASNNESPLPSARQDTDSAYQPQCMLWHEMGTTESCCKYYFEKSCSMGSTTYVWSEETCKHASAVSSTKK